MPFDPEYGLIAVFGLVLAQQLGAPIPAWPALMFSGAYAVNDPLHGATALALATAASIVGSLPWFWAGRRYGDRVLRLTCRISLSPDACVRQTESFFERYGAPALLVAKFVPGLTHVAPPLAGAFGFPVTRFALYFGAGSALGAFVPLALGVACRAQIEAMVVWLGAFGGHALAGIAAAIMVYIAYRWVVRRRVTASLRVARIGVGELHKMITRGDAPIVLDVRSRTHRKLDDRMIPGALAADVEDLGSMLARISTGRSVVVYCACPDDATAMRTAMLLRSRGIRQVQLLAGGFDAWLAAGLVTTRTGGSAA